MISFEQILLVLFSLLKIGSCFGILNLFHFLNQDGEVMEHLQNTSSEHLVYQQSDAM